MKKISHKEAEALLQQGYRYAYSLVLQSSSAEDLLQSAWLSILKHQHKTRQYKLSKAYFFTTIRNQYINQYRREQLVPMVPIEEQHVLEEEQTWSDIEVTALQIDLEKALSNLRTVEREIIFLVYFEGYSATEVAKHMNANRNTILSLMHRSKQKLKKFLRGDLAEVKS